MVSGEKVLNCYSFIVSALCLTVSLLVLNVLNVKVIYGFSFFCMVILLIFVH